MNFTKLKDKPGIMLFLDFEKAFDSLEWNFLYKTLYRMNFGVSFVNHVKSLYSNISSCIMNNGVTSTYFPVGRGVRQGDPLSPYLFILAIELCSCNIRSDTSIKGISIDNSEIKIIQYADDTTCTLKDEHSVRNLFNLFDNFGQISGLKLNVSKSQALWLGSKRFCRDKPFNVLWPDDPIKALGVNFSYNVKLAEENNFVPKPNNLRTILNLWKTRHLTLAGKILLIKTFGLSQFIFLASVISVPNYIIQKVEKMLYDFLWNGGKGFIKRKTIIGNIEQGGLKMIDVNSMFNALKIKWIQRYNNENNNAAWKNIFNDFIKPYGGKCIFYCNANRQIVNLWKQVPTFYKDVLISYFDFIKPDQVEPTSQCIWNNSNILVNNKACLFNKSMFSNGMKLISDLYYENGNVIQFDCWIQRGVSKKHFMLWRSIIGAIPLLWKQVLKQGFERESCVKKGFVVDDDNDIDTMSTKDIYQIFMQRLQEIPSSQKKHHEIFDIDEDLWKYIYTLPYLCTKEVKMQIFQYKILMRCLMTNSRLYKMNIVNDNLCL